MKLLGTNELKNLPEAERQTYKYRQAVRAIIFNPQDQIALMYSSKFGYYKLPGGGIEAGEDVVKALKRECLEEVGCNIEIISEVGRIIEFRDEYQLHQESFCFAAKTVGQIGKPALTPQEIEHGYSVVWVSFKEGIKMLENSKPQDYSGKFIVWRDLVFLREYSLSQ